MDESVEIPAEDLPFWQSIDPRSNEYKAGYYAAKKFRVQKVKGLKNPFSPGTAAADAWQAGWEHGKDKFEPGF